MEQNSVLGRSVMPLKWLISDKKATNICIHKSVRNIWKGARFGCEFTIWKYRVILRECRIARVFF
jgi:hypothetical protein